MVGGRLSLSETCIATEICDFVLLTVLLDYVDVTCKIGPKVGVVVMMLFSFCYFAILLPLQLT